jgi:NAD(P)-dependent dehydrogenase (short-subunit alcohol dehydrogenase family)
MDIDLTDKVAIVTGAGRGIGRSIAHTLASHGAHTAVVDLDQDVAEKVAQEIAETGAKSIAVQADVSKAASVQAMVDRCVEEWGTIDILVNNAGIATTHMIQDMSEADWRRVIDVNLTGPFLCCKAVLPVMRAKGYGKIVNISSVASKRISYNAGANYTASKEGLLGFSRHLAYEVASYGINVNVICPGPTVTPMMTEVATPETLRAREKSVPRGRLATPEDQANAVLYLVSDLSAHICGVALDVDGGALLGWYDIETYRARRARPKGE